MHDEDDDGNKYSSDAVIHFFLHRFKQSPETTMELPTELRKHLFRLEMRILKEEQKSNDTPGTGAPSR